MRDHKPETHATFTRICRALSEIGATVGTASRRRPLLRVTWRRLDGQHSQTMAVADAMAEDLRLAEVRLSSEDVHVAGKTLAVIIAGAMSALCVISIAIDWTTFSIPLAVLAVVVPLMAREILNSYPSRISAKRARLILKHSAEAVNLMIMSLRHEPSVTDAIAFASSQDNAFSRELRGCTWSVILGKCESFEEALLRLGDKWSKYGDDLKTSLHSLVTSSRESTQDGRRRALDRANQAMIAGGRRRIEEYAMSLSMPSMLIFGLGILLPLMVGSFLPMLSWNLWSTTGMTYEVGGSPTGQSTEQMVFVMNILFPAIAFLVAMGPVSEHPLEQERSRPAATRDALLSWAIVLCASCSACALAWLTLEDSVIKSVILLFSAVGPSSIWLLVRFGEAHRHNRGTAGDLEDVLFRTGARMLEGENFESSFHAAAKELSRGRPNAARSLSLRSVLATDRAEDESLPDGAAFGVRNATQGLRITRQAAQKDEASAGMLAMDLASYLKDLRDLESALKNRIQPTISMMKTTALLLAPVVLGVTYAIYLSLASMLGGEGDASDATIFFLVLGVFLAQMDAIVAYFVWGVEGKRGRDRLAETIGGYIIVSELAYSATALVASG